MAENKFALLIASFEYDDPYFRPLKAPAQDIKALSRVLSDPNTGGFSDVKTLLNEPRDELVLAIEEFFDERKRDDLLLLYFSCHGVKDETGRLYYATKNTRHKRLVATAVPAYQVNDLIARSRSRRKILVLDCCYSGAFSKAFLAKGDTAVGVMEEFKQGQGLVTLTASDAFQYSFEGEEIGNAGVCSVFTRALVEGIETGKADRDGDQLISLDELYDYAYERVHSENPQQTPRIQVEVEGKIVIARNPQPPRPAQLSPELEGAIESPFVGNREYAVRELEKLLRGRNKGLALAAHAALIKLKDDDSRKVATAAETCLNSFETAEAERKVAARAEAERLEREQAEPEPEQVAPERFEERLTRETPKAVVNDDAGRITPEEAEEEESEPELAEQPQLVSEAALIVEPDRVVPEDRERREPSRTEREAETQQGFAEIVKDHPEMFWYVKERGSAALPGGSSQVRAEEAASEIQGEGRGSTGQTTGAATEGAEQRHGSSGPVSGTIGIAFAIGTVAAIIARECIDTLEVGLPLAMNNLVLLALVSILSWGGIWRKRTAGWKMLTASAVVMLVAIISGGVLAAEDIAYLRGAVPVALYDLAASTLIGVLLAALLRGLA